MSGSIRRVAVLGSRGYPSTYGGFETLVRNVAPRWAEDGLDVTVYCRAPDDGRDEWDADGVRCRYTRGVESKSLSTLSHGLSAHLDAARRGFDAALVLNVANGFFLPLLRRAGIASALNTDGLEWERGKWGPLARRVFRLGARASARYADVLVADSRAMADVWRETFGVSSEFAAYGAPVLVEQPLAAIRQLGLRPGGYALVVARLIPENNVDLAVDALLAAGPAPAVVVGSANFDSPLERRLGALHDEGKLIWLGHVDDTERLDQLWYHAGVYVHGHSMGGTNPALLQALGAGAPTVTLDTRFNREVIEADEQLFPPDPVALAGMIRATLADPDQRRRWSERGREIVRRRYRWDDVADRYLAILDLAHRRRNGDAGRRPAIG